MESVLRLVKQQASASGAQRVHVVRLRIGEMSGVVPEALEFAFQALAPGTLAAGARLDIERVPARFWCAACENEFVAGDMLAQCPVCEKPSAELRTGREMELASMEIE